MSTTKTEIVRYVQEALNRAGAGLVVDGLWGKNTRAALDALSTTGAAPEPVASPPALEIDEETALLLAELERDEGRVLHAYQDSLGYWTIGIGRLIDKRRGGGITSAEADYLKANDIVKLRSGLDRGLPWWRELDPVRQRAIQNMAFQLGVNGLQAFVTSLGHVRAGRWSSAGASLRQSLWARQTPERAKRVIAMIETGRAA